MLAMGPGATGVVSGAEHADLLLLADDDGVVHALERAAVRIEPLPSVDTGVRLATVSWSHDLLDRTGSRGIEELTHHGEVPSLPSRDADGLGHRGYLRHRGPRLPPDADRLRENRSATPCVHPRSTVLRVKIDDPGSDAALMAEFAAREERAAGTLFDRFASRIYGLGVVMLGSHQAAQDLVQDTFVKLWRTAERYDPQRGRLETWVLLTARSLAIDGLRRRVLESRSLQAIGIQPEDDPEPLPDERAVLSPEQRSALELAYFGGRTTAEVAALEGIPQGTVKTRIRAALLRLRDEMAKDADHDV